MPPPTRGENTGSDRPGVTPGFPTHRQGCQCLSFPSDISIPLTGLWRGVSPIMQIPRQGFPLSSCPGPCLWLLPVPDLAHSETPPPLPQGLGFLRKQA